jgi:hypothetical protein
MALPGFDELRVPPRFWMLGILTLSVAAGLAFPRLVPRRPLLRGAAFVRASAGPASLAIVSDHRRGSGHV